MAVVPITQKWYRVDLLWELVKTNFKMRYQNSVLGILWVMIKPYSTFIVLYTVWSKISSTSDVKDFSLYLLMGVIVYTYFQELIVFGQMSLLERAHIILKVSFPRQIATISALTSALINLCINLVLLFIIMIGRGVRPSIVQILYFFFIIFVMFVWGAAISFFISILTIRVRDLKNIIELLFFLLIWLTPVTYTINSSVLGKDAARIISRNPLAFILNQARASFGIYSEINMRITLVYLGVGLFAMYISWKYFNKRVKKIAEYF